MLGFLKDVGMLLLACAYVCVLCVIGAIGLFLIAGICDVLFDHKSTSNYQHEEAAIYRGND